MEEEEEEEEEGDAEDEEDEDEEQEEVSEVSEVRWGEEIVVLETRTHIQGLEGIENEMSR